jgi:hypothetical protein
VTFSDIQTEILEDLNLTSAVATARVGRTINRRYREIISSIGLETSARAIVTSSSVIGDRTMTFTGTLKILSVWDNRAKPVVSITRSGTVATVTVTAHGFANGVSVIISGAVQTDYNINAAITVVDANTFTYTVANSPVTPATGTITAGLQQVQTILTEETFDWLRNQPLSTPPPQIYAISRMGSTSVTIYLDCVPTSVFILSADVMQSTVTLSGTDEPLFDQNFHDILVAGGKVVELLKMEKPELAAEAEARFQSRLADLRYFIIKSAYLDIYQSKTSRNTNFQNRLI